MRKAEIPWAVVLFFCVMFWPAGLLLLWLKMRSDLKATLIASEILKTLAWILVVLIGACLIVAMLEEGFSEDSPAWGFFILLSGAAAILVASIITKRNAILYRRLIGIIVNDGITSMDAISRTLNMPYDKVHQLLENMISRNFLPNAYISEVERAVVWQRPRTEREPEMAYDIVYCKNCGAQKEVPVGRIETCDFCGSKLKAG